MRQECEECGDYKTCNEDGICYDCLQDQYDLEEWVPEDGFEKDEPEDEEE